MFNATFKFCVDLRGQLFFVVTALRFILAILIVMKAF